MKDIRIVLQEIDKHKERLEYAKSKIEKWQLTQEILDDPEIVETIDSFIFRFSKMQDSMGEKLFPLILETLGEETRNKPFIDILNKLEKLEFIPSADEWKKLRNLRNSLTHTYPWEKEILLEEIKEALKYSDEMVKIYIQIKEKLNPYLSKENKTRP
ncbi:hypothetical protein [Sulfurihydrogenibium azorense]|uniref:hypothetical protein n=1 Tax=Sulfurihydrogenibium azorense TaxID=309806 RepID=UPI00240A9298|nr:hypothetical protein [Sulfurihydrogenibium azorense]MDM7274250.1 hypothetical protein [Sulfurihydrogenibium azorense]